MRALKVAIVGFGTVGRSVAKILVEQPSPPLRLTHICNRNIERKRVPWLPPEVQWTENIDEVLGAGIDILVELVGGLSPAEDWVRRALESGKSVVTANKMLIAHCGPELAELARANGQHLEFGASVAGGIPVLSGLQEGLAGDRLHKISGILNGTCNYILTRMEAAGVPFAEALEEAQNKGFAEANPTDDVDGYDARAKLGIIARVGLHCKVRASDIVCRSITCIDAVDFTYASQLNCTIRQISRAEIKKNKLFASVEPCLVPMTSPLARVQASQNLVMASGEFGGETVFSGYGAGGDPTAVAVVSDLVAIARRGERTRDDRNLPEAEVKVTSDFTSPHYVRFLVKDRPGIIASLAGIFSRHEINIDSVLQKPGYAKSSLPFVITLESCSSSQMEKALQEIRKLDFLVQPPVNLPIVE